MVRLDHGDESGTGPRRAGAREAQEPKRPKRRTGEAPVDGGTDRTSGTHGNRNRRAARKGGDALETSAGKPSRKSTRRSTGRIKRTTNQQQEAMRRTRSPQARAARAAARKR